MSKRKTEQVGGSKKKSKSNLENLSGQLDDENMKPNSPRSKIAAPEGVQRFSDDEEDPNTALINISIELKKADKRIDGLLKTKNEKTKRRRNVQQMQATAVSDSEEDDGAAEQMAVTAREQANALQAEEGDPEPVVLQQVLFPAHVGSPPQCTFEGAEDLIQGCTAELQSLSASAASKVDVPCSLLLNGLLQRHCFTSSRQCSAALVLNLFQLLALSKSLKVATAAFKTLMALLGDTHQYEALLGCRSSLPTALRALGLDTKAAADKGSSSAKDGLKAADSHAVVKGTMYHLQLLLRTFAAVCRYQQQGKAAGSLGSAGLQELLLMLLALRLDPIGQLLAVEIQVALESLLDAFQGKDWGHSIDSLAGQLTGVGPSHRAHLAALKQLPAHSSRGFALQQAAAAKLLQGLCQMPAKGSMTEQYSCAASADSPTNAEEVVAKCSWFQAGGAAVAKACQGESGENCFSLWELESCIKTADLLLWPHIKQAKETGTGGLSANCRSKWQEFIQALSRGLSNSHKVAAHSLKLHIAVMQAWDNRK
ncbi:TPA: hypothetical protein ACH3X3_000611 [Trebouxia sp. C0006]